MSRALPALALALVAPQLAAAAAPPALPCLTASETTALATFSLGSAIRGAAVRCGPVLAPNAYLERSGERLAHRYDATKDRVWPRARAAFVRISTGYGGDAAKAVAAMPDAALRPLADDFVRAAVIQRLDTRHCGRLSGLIEVLSPLPPAASAAMIALATGLASREGEVNMGSIRVCRR